MFTFIRFQVREDIKRGRKYSLVRLTLPSHLSCWFRSFDSLIIILTFAISVASQGPIRSIGSLVIVLRLWRLARISEETILGAAERIEGLQQRNQEMSDEIKELREQLGLTHTTDVDVESII